MFSKLRSRYGVAGPVAVLALMVALSGVPAVAQPVADTSAGIANAVKRALGLAKSANKRSANALRLARQGGPAGPLGPQGPAGIAGPDGADGGQGIQGGEGAPGASVFVDDEPAGDNCEVGGQKISSDVSSPKISYVCDGKIGKDGTSVTNTAEPEGANCTKGGSKFAVGASTPTYACNGADGADGDPWTVGGTLPSSETLKGTWALGEVPATPPSGFAFASISYGIPLATAPSGISGIRILGVGATHADCPGTVSDPKANAGKVCVYTAELTNAVFESALIDSIETPSTKVGLLVKFKEVTEGARARGTWAVTAP